MKISPWEAGGENTEMSSVWLNINSIHLEISKNKLALY